MADSKNVTTSFKEDCEGYLIKPVTPKKLQQVLAKLDRTVDCV